jgi:hypothetical protein
VLHAAQQLELHTGNIREHGALFQHVTPGETKIFSALSLPSVTFIVPNYVFIEFVLIGKLLHALPLFRGLHCWFTTRSVQSIVCPAFDAVYHITEILLGFTDMQSGFHTSITMVLVASKGWRENSLERNCRDTF